MCTKWTAIDDIKKEGNNFAKQKKSLGYFLGQLPLPSSSTLTPQLLRVQPLRLEHPACLDGTCNCFGSFGNFGGLSERNSQPPPA